MMGAAQQHAATTETPRRPGGAGGGEERANQGQASVSTCTLRSREKSSAKSRRCCRGRRQSQCSPRRRSCSAQDQGSARASVVMVRPAGAVPSRMLETIRGERNASGTSSRMCRSTFPSRLASTAKLPTRPLSQLVDPAASLGNRHQQASRDATASSAYCARAHG